MPFDLLIQDLLDKKDNVVGTQILKQLPYESKVIVLTRSADHKVHNELTDPLIKVDFKIFYKVDIRRKLDSFVSLIEDMTGLQRVQSKLFELNLTKNNVKANYQISVVTEEHLIDLIAKYLANRKGSYPNYRKSVNITPLESGQSGALIFQIEIFFKQNTSVFVLFKVDKIKSNIDKELASAVGYNYKQINPKYRLEYDNDLLTSTLKNTSWYALTANFIDKGKTLKRSFLETTDYAKIKALLSDLFGKCLKALYSKNIKVFQNSAIIYPVRNILEVLNERRQAFILNTVEELSILSEDIKEARVKEIFWFSNEEEPLTSEKIKEYK